MISLIKPFAFALLTILITGSVVAQSTYQVDPSAAKVIWTGKKVTGQHTGTVDLQKGTIGWGPEGLTSTDVTIDMTSITNTDLDPEYAADLVSHLKSGDFFNTMEFHTATFKTSAVEKIEGAEAGQPNYKITGDLTIKGITKPVTLDVRAWQEKKGVRATGTLRFDRTLYNIKYRSGQFFDYLGDKMINDEVEITFDLIAK